MNRRQIEFACLAGFPAGTVLDGETVVLRGGKPDFGLLQSRLGLREMDSLLDVRIPSGGRSRRFTFDLDIILGKH